MSTVSSVVELEHMTRGVRERLTALRPLADHGRDSGGMVVVDLVRDACDELDGYLAEVVAWAGDARNSGAQRRFHDASRALSACASACTKAVNSYVTCLGGENSLHRLRQLAADHPDVWASWSVGVGDDVAELWGAIVSLRAQVDRCWQELVEQLCAVPLAVDARVVTQPHLVSEGSAGGQ